jgi:hypothetical protein
MALPEPALKVSDSTMKLAVRTLMTTIAGLLLFGPER